jgi:hypothetical protein
MLRYLADQLPWMGKPWQKAPRTAIASNGQVIAL